MSKKPVVIIALIAVLLTAAAFLHDYLYDPPSVPYTTGQHVAELLTIGLVYGLIIFGVLYLPYLAWKSLFPGKRGNG